MELDLAVPARALAIGAHPDDIEFGCGGTLAKWSGAGAEVHLLILTDGSKGSWVEGEDLAALIELRKVEARAAARVLGATDVHFLGLVDGELESGADERALVCEVIRTVRPTLVLGHDPWKRYRLHPDHRHAGWLTVDGIVAARDPHFFPGRGGSHHRPDDLLLFEADEPDHLERIDDHGAVKADALLEHRSQWRSTMAIEPDAEAAGIEAFRGRIDDAARADAALGDGQVAFAEAFRHLTDL